MSKSVIWEISTRHIKINVLRQKLPGVSTTVWKYMILRGIIDEKYICWRSVVFFVPLLCKYPVCWHCFIHLKTVEDVLPVSLDIARNVTPFIRIQINLLRWAILVLVIHRWRFIFSLYMWSMEKMRFSKQRSEIYEYKRGKRNER